MSEKSSGMDTTGDLWMLLFVCLSTALSLVCGLLTVQPAVESKRPLYQYHISLNIFIDRF